MREEREQFLEYQQLDRQLEKMLGLLQCWQYFQAQRVVKNSGKNLEDAKNEIQAFENAIQENIESAKNLEKEIEEMTNNAQTVIYFLYLSAMILLHN